MLSRWPIRNKLLLGIALLLVIVLTMSISSFQGTYAYRNLVRSLSSRATELPLATQLLTQVGELRVILAELQAQLPFSDLSISPTGQQLGASFCQKFAHVRETANDYRDELDEHEHTEFHIGDIGDVATDSPRPSELTELTTGRLYYGREWQKLREIEVCLTRIEQLTTDRADQAGTDEAAAPEHEINASNAESDHAAGDALAKENDPDAAETATTRVKLGPRYRESELKLATSPAAWYCDYDRISSLASEELVQLQNAARDLPSYLQGHMHELAGDVKLRYRAWILATWFCAVAATLLTVLFIVLLYRWVFRPLRCLVKGSRRVAGGDFNYRIELSSHDEMGELAEAMNDMTTRFRTIRDDLDRQVQIRTKQVVRSEQLASVGFLAAGVAHEINNPLASIALCAESLEGRLLEACGENTEQTELVGRYLRMIQTEAFRCKEITEKLLDFSRVGEVQRHGADLRELVQTVIDMVRHLGKYQNRQLEFLAGEPVIALVNAQEIKQVVLNLVTNALDSVDAGGKLAIELRKNGEFAEMTFADDGCGMTEEVQRHLFEPFFTRKRGGQGTGLGLSIVYRIVSDHGGQIEASSDGPGRGSKFQVTLPLAEMPNRESMQTLIYKESSHRYQAA
ncbi:MAG: HAMP domain-containing histidine kinase [Pirellulales bacterium]|nr:HAMP domain-containing histidine kinase [Pirellulales bacterium]